MPHTGQAHIVVEPRPDGRWARQKNGTRRAASLHSTQAEAIDAARAQARRERTEMVVKGRDGRIQSRDSYGPDPSRGSSSTNPNRGNYGSYGPDPGPFQS